MPPPAFAAAAGPPVTDAPVPGKTTATAPPDAAAHRRPGESSGATLHRQGDALLDSPAQRVSGAASDTDVHAAARARPDTATLVRAYGRHVFQAAFRVLGDTASAEDVQQDVFLRLVEGAAAAQVDSWPAWLAAAATRLAIDRLRHRHRWWRRLPSWRATQPDAMPSAEDEVESLERAARLRAALARLKPRDAECFVLRHVQGLDIAAIAEATQMSPNHVSVTLHRATRSLAARLAEPAGHGQGATS